MLAALTWAVLAGAAPVEGRSYLAVVVGLSDHANLDPKTDLAFARGEAALLAGLLREEALYDHVFLLTDTAATWRALQGVLRDEVRLLSGPQDVLLVYFVGHGAGGDTGAPALSFYDSPVEGVPVAALARDLGAWSRAGTTLVVTDAIHATLTGPLHGPSAAQWPPMAPGTMIVSSTPTGVAAVDGAFGERFAAGIAGAADADGDTFVTAAELTTWLGAAGQVPDFAGAIDPSTVVGRAARGPSMALVGSVPEGMRLYPERTFDKVKFVFPEGVDATAACGGPPVACGPSCYVWDVPAGRCDLTAVLGGATVEGRVALLSRGLYTCAPARGKLACTGPPGEGPPADAP